MARYLVVSDTSTRLSANPASPDYDRWLYWAAGDTCKRFEPHLLASARFY